MTSVRIKTAVMGLGHIGSYAARAVTLAPDMELAGIIDLPARLPEITAKYPNTPVVDAVEKLPVRPEVVILAVPTRMVEKVAPPLLKAGIHTVDCFDMHGEPFLKLREALQSAAAEGKAASIMGSGVDPGMSSLIRAIFEIWAPTGLTYVTYGPGMSMGHTVAAKSYPGVRDALSITRPGDPGCHKRDLYLELAPGADFQEVKTAILQDPYFCHDDVRVFQVENVAPLVDMGHAIHIQRKGGASGEDNQLLAFDTTFHNPASTGQILAASARAVTRLQPGAYSMLQVPLGAFLSGDFETLIKRLS